MIENTVKIKLSQDRFVLVDKEDCERIGPFPWHYNLRGYAVCSMYMGITSGKPQKCRMSMHRFILHPPEKFEIDHINGNGLDNRKVNLRVCTHAQNLANQKHHCNTTSKYRGVTWDKTNKNWRASIMYDYGRINLGSFDSEIKAAMAYDLKAKELFGEFARLNFPVFETCLT